MKKRIAPIAICFLFLLNSQAYPQTPPPGETGGGIQRQNQQIQAERELEKQIKTKKKKAEAPVVEEKAAPAAAEGEKVLIKKIEVRGGDAPLQRCHKQDNRGL
jgi:hemolysin activation/secretion protein